MQSHQASNEGATDLLGREVEGVAPTGRQEEGPGGPGGWLLVGALSMLLANGRWILPAAIWIASICLLRVARLSRPHVGAGVILVVSFASNLLVWQGMLPLPMG